MPLNTTENILLVIKYIQQIWVFFFFRNYVKVLYETYIHDFYKVEMLDDRVLKLDIMHFSGMLENIRNDWLIIYLLMEEFKWFPKRLDYFFTKLFLNDDKG